MGQPVLFQKLTKGLFLCGKNFANFVATFNWLVDCCRNLKGDADTNNDQGHIRVTGIAQGRPIISFSGKLPMSGSGTIKGNTSDSEEISLEGAVVEVEEDSNLQIKTYLNDGTPTIKITPAEVKIKGNTTDSEEITLTNVSIISATDSNVQIKTEKIGTSQTITIGAYYT